MTNLGPKLCSRMLHMLGSIYEIKPLLQTLEKRPSIFHNYIHNSLTTFCIAKLEPLIIQALLRP